MTMEEMRHDPDYIYQESEWDNGIKVAVAVCISAITEGSGRIRTLVWLTYTVTIILLLLLRLFLTSTWRAYQPDHGIHQQGDKASG